MYENDGWHPVHFDNHELVYDTYLTVTGEGFDTVRVMKWITEPVETEYLPYLKGEAQEMKLPENVLDRAKETVKAMKPPVDFVARNEGSVWQFQPMTDDAKTFAYEHLGLESWQWMGPTFNVDYRLGTELVVQLRDEGWEVVFG